VKETKEYIHNKFNPDNRKSPIVIRRNFSRIDLAKLFCEVGFSSGAEIGVKKGQYSEVLCRENKGLKHICVDPWVPYFSIGGTYMNLAEVGSNYRDCQNRLKEYNVHYIKNSSEKAVSEVPENSLDFVYIDGDHTYNAANHDVKHWSKRVRTGGIVSGHDYYQSRLGKTTTKVAMVVDSYAEKMGVELFITNDRLSSWFFVK
jgi:hypothetical protein